ncbi:hypothetical protein D3C71_79120 [compost metagenome]
MKAMELLTDRSKAAMTHNGQEITWSVALLEKTSYKGEFDIFEQINGFWKHQPAAVQDKIFDVYQRIRNVYDATWDTSSELTRALYPLVAELFTYHELPAVRHWVDFHSTIATPETLKDTFKESYEQPGTRERTYLKEDYRNLVVLTVALRAMVPVWGEFISLTYRENGTTLKEYYAFRLLAHANVMKSEAMERLRVYVEHSLPADKSKAAAILGGISSEDFPTWVLGLVVVRRLTVGDVRGMDPQTTLITLIYKYIHSRVKSHDNSFIGLVKEKSVEGGSSQEGENNLSKLEGYKVKQDIPAGDIVALEYFMQDVHGLAARVCPDMDPALLQQSLTSIQALEKEQIREPQMLLTQWIMSKAVPPRGLRLVSKKQCLDAMAITQAALWHRGHLELAALVSAIAQTNDHGELQQGGVDSRARIPKETIEELHELFPYPRRPSGKSAKVGRQNSPGQVAVENMAELFSECDWRLTLPADWVAKVTNSRNNRRYYVPHDIKVKLANLVKSLGQRSF